MTKKLFIIAIFLMLLYTGNVLKALDDTIWCKYTYPTSIYAVKFTPDGQYLAAGVGSQVIIYNALTGDTVKSYYSNGTVYSFDINNTETLIAIPVVYDSIIVYNMQTNTLVTSMKGSLAKFSEDGNYLITDEGKIYDTHTWSIVGSFTIFSSFPDPENGENMLDLEISPDNKYISTGGMTYKNGVSISGIIRLYNLSNLKDSNYYTLEQGTLVTSYPRVCFSPDGKYLAGEAIDDTVRIWSLSDRTIYKKFCHYSEVDAIAFSPDGNYLVEGSGSINIWNILSNEIEYSYNIHQYFSIGGSLGISINPSQTLIAIAGGGGGIFMLNAKWNSVSVSDKIINITQDTIYPNPTNSVANIEFTLTQSAQTTINIYDTNLNLIANIFNGFLDIGLHTYTWNTSSISNGIYFCNISINNSISTIKIIVTK